MGDNKPISKIVPDYITRNAEAIKTMNNKNFQLLDYGCYLLPPIVSLITIHDKFNNNSEKKSKEKTDRKTNLPTTTSVIKNNLLLNYFNYHIRYLNANSSYTGFYGINNTL
jgi:hypothetical protein